MDLIRKADQLYGDIVRAEPFGRGLRNDAARAELDAILPGAQAEWADLRSRRVGLEGLWAESGEISSDEDRVAVLEWLRELSVRIRNAESDAGMVLPSDWENPRARGERMAAARRDVLASSVPPAGWRLCDPLPGHPGVPPEPVILTEAQWAAGARYLNGDERALGMGPEES